MVWFAFARNLDSLKPHGRLRKYRERTKGGVNQEDGADPELAEEMQEKTPEGGDDEPFWLGLTPEASFGDDYKEVGEQSINGDHEFERPATRKDGLKSVVRIVKRTLLDAAELRVLRKEARLLRELQNRHIIKLHGWYEEEVKIFVALESCEGGELFNRTASQKDYTELQPRDVLRELLSAVQYLHSQSIVLGNLRPEHLLLSDTSPNAVLKIADLKFATKNCGTVSADRHCQFPEYSAPEVVKKKPYGSPADIWSIGVIAYILVGGYLPISGAKSQADVIARIKVGKFKFHRENWKSTSPSVQELIKSMLQKDPGNRITAKRALCHKWVTQRDDTLAEKSLLPALDRFRLTNAKRKLKHAVICAAFLVYGLTVAVNDEQAVRAYQTVEFHIEELQAINTTHPAEAVASEAKVVPGKAEDTWQASRGFPLEHLKRHTLAETLGSELKTYSSAAHGVRLTVQRNETERASRHPVFLRHTARVVKCEDKSFLVTAIVESSSHGPTFSPPLLLDFRVEPCDSSRWSRPNLSQILDEYQVLYQKDDDDDLDWSVMPREKLRLNVVREADGKVTYLQAEIDHFCRYSLGWKVLEPKRVRMGKQRDKGKVVVRNASTKPLVVVSVPVSHPTSMQQRNFFSVTANKVGGAYGGGRRVTNAVFDEARCPKFTTVLPDDFFEIDLPVKRDCVDLLLCTAEVVPQQKSSDQFAAESKQPASSGDAEVAEDKRPENSGGQVCTANERPASSTHRGDRRRVVRLWDSIRARGGRDISVLPDFYDGVVQNERYIEGRGNKNLKDLILSLDKEEGMDTPPSQQSTVSGISSVSDPKSSRQSQVFRAEHVFEDADDTEEKSLDS